MKTFLAILLAAPLYAQLQLSVVTGSGEKPAGAQYNTGSTPAGESSDYRFRLRNTAAGALDVVRISVAGAGFAIADRPPLPYKLASGATVDFTVRFQPSALGNYSASLTVNTSDVLLTGSGVATATLRGVAGGGTVDFGQVERGVRKVRRLTIENVFPAPVSVKQIAVSGTGFSGPGLVTLPLAVGPQSSVDFEIVFTPSGAGGYAGTLQLDGRSYKLAGVAVNPPNPKPVIDTAPGPLPSASQVKASVHFESPARVSGKGTLKLELRPDGEAAVDPSVVFSTGARAVEFTFSEGDSQAQFAGSPSIAFQTGTMSGTLVLTAQLGEYNEAVSLPVNPAPAGLEAVHTTHSSFSVTVDVMGYDNTRSASQAVFTFTTTSGATLPAIRCDVAAEFRRHFTSAQSGGAFLLHAVFPVTGNAAEIASVEIEMVNSAGTSRSQKTPIE